ncbi:E3 ubiquitin-protein ligase RNF181-like [Periplaneta americana]|uniref:E3 ubiquitin-protein ligase RNF181-like n=1 Tax=Periplaneta americana TaxID=6978 RepID=UPI0037E8948E
MADYFEEMGWEPLAQGQTPNQLLHLARLLRDFGMWEELGVGQKLPPCASKECVENLAQKQVTSSGEKCPVCLKEHEVGETVKVLPCHHAFHSTCILPWLERTNSCPLCRYELPTDDEEYEMYRKEKLRAKQREAELETLHNSMFS